MFCFREIFFFSSFTSKFFPFSFIILECFSFLDFERCDVYLTFSIFSEQRIKTFYGIYLAWIPQQDIEAIKESVKKLQWAFEQTHVRSWIFNEILIIFLSDKNLARRVQWIFACANYNANYLQSTVKTRGIKNAMKNGDGIDSKLRFWGRWSWQCHRLKLFILIRQWKTVRPEKTQRKRTSKNSIWNNKKYACDLMPQIPYNCYILWTIAFSLQQNK